MAIDYTDVNLFLDRMCQVYSRALGTTGFGIGESGDSSRARKAAADLEADVLATADSSIIVGTASVPGMLTDVVNWEASLSAVRIACPRAVLNRIERQVRALGLSGVNSLDQFLSYYNGAAHGPGLALQSQYFRKLFYQWKGSYPTATNLFFELTLNGVFEGTTFAHGLRQLLQGTGQTAGDSISTDYAGGVPYLLVSGFAGTSGLVTVTGTQDLYGTRTTGKTWTATVTGNGAFALAVGTADANALIAAVSGIVAAGSITAPTLITVEAHRPSGRLAMAAA